MTLDPEYRPTVREPRVRTRYKNWFQGSHWYMNAFPEEPRVWIDESIIVKEPTEEELWERHARRE